MKAEVTPFRARVFAATRKIPRGKVTTYQLLARAVGCASSRAIGQALKHNPYAPKVPCHRVIRSDLTLGGFAGQVAGPDVARKKRLLAREGVRFKGKKLADPGRLFTFRERPPTA